MSLLIYLSILIVVYIVTFKEEFTEEKIAKVTPFLVIVISILMLLGLLGSITRSV